ncbi:MBL fold metallo-hydrolase [bacterium]|nr:MBL fold metallo-hydrolase [bacterium]
MNVNHFFDPRTYTLTYVVWDETTLDSVIIDPVLDYDPASSTYNYESLEKVDSFIKGKKLKTHLILETHAHADHLTGAQELKKRLPGSIIVIGKRISEVQEAFKVIYNLKEEFKTDGSQFDKVLAEGEEISAGSIKVKSIQTPGHTPACCTYLIEDMAFTGDALFMPDYGVGRCDFPKGSAEDLFDSVHEKLFKLPDSTKVYTAHDYMPNDRPLRWESTIGEQKKSNIHLNASTTKEEFVAFRTSRDKTLNAPKLLLPSIEVNVDAGRLPKPEDNGVSYLKIPVTAAKANKN